MTWRCASLGAILLGSAVALRELCGVASLLAMASTAAPPRRHLTREQRRQQTGRHPVCSTVFAQKCLPNSLPNSLPYRESFAQKCLLKSVCSRRKTVCSKVFAQKCLLKSVCSKVFAQKCLPNSMCSELFAQNRLLQDGLLGKSVCQTVCMPVQTIRLAKKCLPYSKSTI